jgi:hypothetical protein
MLQVQSLQAVQPALRPQQQQEEEEVVMRQPPACL